MRIRDAIRDIISSRPVYEKIQPRDVKFSTASPFMTLLGPVGTRKSATAFWLAKSEAWKRGLAPVWWNVTELQLAIRTAIKNGNERDRITMTVNAPLLVLDDLGAEKATDYSVPALGMIINIRGERQKPTIVTSNLTLDEIGAKLDGRIADRLRRFGPVYEFEEERNTRA